MNTKSVIIVVIFVLALVGLVIGAHFTNDSSSANSPASGSSSVNHDNSDITSFITGLFNDNKLSTQLHDKFLTEKKK